MVLSILLWEFLSGGGMLKENLPPSLLCEGIAMLRAIARDLTRAGFSVVIPLDLRLISLTNWLPGAEIKPVNQTEELVDILQQQACKAGNFFIISPESDDILLTYTQLLEKCGQNWGCSSEFIRIFGDKWETWNYLHAKNIPMPRTWLIPEDSQADGLQDSFDIDIDDTLVIKPASGAGAGGIFTCSGHAFNNPAFRESLVANLNGKRYLIQEFIPGQAYSANFAVVGGEIHLLCVNEQLITLSTSLGTESTYLGGISPAQSILANISFNALEYELQELIQALPSPQSGFFGVDFTCDADGKFYVIEVNARLTTSYITLAPVTARNPAALLLGQKPLSLEQVLLSSPRVAYYRKLFIPSRQEFPFPLNNALSIVGYIRDYPDFYACPPLLDSNRNLAAFISVVGPDCGEVRRLYNSAREHFYNLDEGKTQ